MKYTSFVQTCDEKHQIFIHVDLSLKFICIRLFKSDSGLFAEKNDLWLEKMNEPLHFFVSCRQQWLQKIYFTSSFFFTSLWWGILWVWGHYLVVWPTFSWDLVHGPAFCHLPESLLVSFRIHCFINKKKTTKNSKIGHHQHVLHLNRFLILYQKALLQYHLYLNYSLVSWFFN